MKNLTTFVVDDMQLSLDMLVNELSLNPDIEIIGTATTIIDAAKFLQNNQPDILFLDIILGNHTAFDLLEILPNLNSKIIFVTASDEFALKAFKFSAIDYILKPYSSNEIKIAIQKAKNNLNSSNLQLQVLQEHITNRSNSTNTITLNTAKKIHIVTIKNIIKCESTNNYTTFYVNNKNSNTTYNVLDIIQIVVSKPLKYYTELLKDYGFIRVHQSFLVNKYYIKEFIKNDGGYLILLDKSTVYVSQRLRNFVLKEIKK